MNINKSCNKDLNNFEKAKEYINKHKNNCNPMCCFIPPILNNLTGPTGASSFNLSEIGTYQVFFNVPCFRGRPTRINIKWRPVRIYCCR